MNRASSESGVVLGITGGIACGKSEVGRIMEGFGFMVLDADTVARDLLHPGNDQYRQVLDRFGEDMLDASGEIDRRKLARTVFADRAELSALNDIVHPRTLEICRQWVGDRREDHRVAVIMPLLFEVAEIEIWDAIICVESRREMVLRRLNKRGLSDEEARQRIDSQMDIDEKMLRSDYVVSNNGDLLDLVEATRKMIVWVESKERN